MKSEARKLRAGSLFNLALAFVFAIAGFLSLSVYAQSAIELYNQANESYKAKQFVQAIDDYEKLIAQGYKSPEVYYNLGNCYYKTDSFGKSILNYERALKLAPKDDDINYNLELAKRRTVDNIQPIPQLAIIRWWNDFVTFNSSKGWGIFALIAIWVAILVFTISFFIGRRRFFNMVGLLFLFLSFTSLSLAVYQHQEEEKSDAAIVMVSGSYVKSAPDAGASNLFMIHDGTRIQILDEVGEWNKIRLEDGKVGWIEKEKFDRI